MTLCRIQRCLKHTQSFQRYASSSQSRPLAETTMPPTKMRALISLYHQADTFITPETLSRRIDEAFIPPLREENNGMLALGGASAAQTRELSHFKLQDLREALESQRKAPKVTEPDREMRNIGLQDYSYGKTWSGEIKGRERKVMEALYGVERASGTQVVPGLEVLVEEEDRIEGDVRADEE